MALKYKMYQLHTAKHKYNNYWYARVAYMGTLDTRQLQLALANDAPLQSRTYLLCSALW